MIIAQERVLKLKDENITKRDYNAIVKEVNDRVDYIWRTLCKLTNRKLEWYAFQNDVEFDRGEGSDGGSFDIETDFHYIRLHGNFSERPFDGAYSEGFPTYFLWTDDSVWIEEVLTHIESNKTKLEKEKQEAKQKKESSNAYRKAIIKSIKSKLTKEELNYINFV